MVDIMGKYRLLKYNTKVVSRLDIKASAQFVYEAKDYNATATLAAYLAKQSLPGTVIGLDGDLGAGKTAFSKAFAKGLEVQQLVNSPTFTIIKEYEGRLPFYHMDVYRLSLDEADELGLDEYFYGTGVTLVEWASIIEELLPSELLRIEIETVSEFERRFFIYGTGSIYEKWVATMQENGVL